MLNYKWIGFLMLINFYQTCAFKQYDNFISEAQLDCKLGKGVWSCLKYRLGRYLWSIELSSFNFINQEKNSFELVTFNNTEIEELFPEARFSSDDLEISKVYKFIQRVISNFALNNGVRLNVNDSNGVHIEEIEEEGRGRKLLKHKKKKKLKILFSVIALVKLFHIKALLGLVLLSIGLVQLMLVGAGGGLFFYLRRNTVCKIQPYLVHSPHSSSVEPDISYSSEKWPSSSFSKDWASGRAYTAYSP